jgi:hypothetical protein
VAVRFHKRVLAARRGPIDHGPGIPEPL